MQNLSVDIQLFHTDRGTDRRTDTTELIADICNFVNVPKLGSYLTENTPSLSYVYSINQLMQFIQNVTR
jgi:hypothetical protein